MPTYGINEVLSCTIKDSGGNTVAELTPDSFSWNGTIRSKRELTNQDKLNPKNIKKVIFNPPATVVIFNDDTKMIAKTHDEYNFDPEKGFMACMMRVMFDSRADFNRLMEKSIEESKENLEGFWYIGKK